MFPEVDIKDTASFKQAIEQWKSIAKNPNAKARTLQVVYDKSWMLASDYYEIAIEAVLEDYPIFVSPREEIQKYLAQNPNTPPDILIDLSFEFLESLSENPALSMVAIEYPEFYYRIVEEHASADMRFNQVKINRDCLNSLRQRVKKIPDDYPQWFQDVIFQDNSTILSRLNIKG